MIQYTSRIASQVPTIEAFYIDYLDPGRLFGEDSHLKGWLNVETSQGGVAHYTIGTLCFDTDQYMHNPDIPDDRRSAKYSDILFLV